MTLRLTLLALALLIPLPVVAQIAMTPQTLTIHEAAGGQKATYTDPSEWPVTSCQPHWAPGNAMLPSQDFLLNPALAHAPHIDVQCPKFAEIPAGTTQIICRATLTQFHTAGYIDHIFSEIGYFLFEAPTLHWEDYSHITGDPMGIVVTMGWWVIEPARSSGLPFGPTGWNPHGWSQASLGVHTVFDNGSEVTAFNQTAIFYSLFDLSIPEQPLPEGRKIPQRCSQEPQSPTDPLNGYGNLIVELDGYTPIAPMLPGQSLTVNATLFSYGVNPNLPPEIREAREDMDLHNGNIGHELSTLGPTTMTFNANAIGAGTHKVAIILSNTTGPNGAPGFTPNEEASELQVLTVTVDGATPTICTDPLATNTGGPLPCVYPVVPPPPIWTLGTVFSTPTPTGLHFEVCAGLNPNDVNACHVVP